ncbi:uncharacterized protein FOMMEDRAFT_159594 [Fomitiporia mediterranea MF3/22]|uniref:uncharacterized protein n=1 Tax=Fomitiporia mediterranea (strain MF3/22) TaxID=694068 RepID=UPI0004407F73|nr:uncharacterized protein FOMMEDRAFT_159594 [Fomitiporia mediterranea MF3/22]EJD00013.1 hypothetical protein FOMMEDRAFT_159594 [Fomitiporia mediterranea MF3/22]
MKLLNLLSVLFLTASSALAQIISPIFYPPDGTYYIYNVQYKRVFDDYDFNIIEGNPIIGWPTHLPGHPAIPSPSNQQWVIKTVDNSTDHKVTIRSLETIQQKPSAGGYAINNDGKIVTSKTTQPWTLQPVPNACAQFMIADCNIAIILDSGQTNNALNAQLKAEVIHKNATNQHWVFVPVDQITEFLAENGSG